jgi:phospholipase/carboxylesterase
LNQWPSPELTEELVRRSLQLPEVHQRESRVATTGTKALWLPEEIASGPSEAFIDDLEFCHLHCEGGVHLTLPKAARVKAVELGWAEPHPSAPAGFLPDTLVLVYGPRDGEELAAVFSLVEVSYRFAAGHFDQTRARIWRGTDVGGSS